MEFPIIPCNLCGSQENLQRKKVAEMLQDWEQNPGRIDNIFAALRNVVPSHRRYGPVRFQWHRHRPGKVDEASLFGDSTFSQQPLVFTGNVESNRMEFVRFERPAAPAPQAANRRRRKPAWTASPASGARSLRPLSPLSWPLSRFPLPLPSPFLPSAGVAPLASAGRVCGSVGGRRGAARAPRAAAPARRRSIPAGVPPRAGAAPAWQAGDGGRQRRPASL